MQDIRLMISYFSLFFSPPPLSLHRKVTFFPEPVGLVSSVSPEDVAASVRLEIPRRNQNDVALSYPNTPFQLAANPAQPFFAILALNHDSVATKHLHGYSKNIASAWQNHVRKIIFVCNFSFTQFSTPHL
jgi:hypothetical protein